MKKSNLTKLKSQFDKVYLKHVRPDNQTGTTIAILVKGSDAFVGVSRCHVGDQFNREIGRNISLGRALSLFEGGEVKADSNRFVINDTIATYDALISQVESILGDAQKALTLQMEKK